MKEKNALITGGASGIGKRTAEALAEQGIHLVINYRKSEEQAKQLAQYLSTKYGTKNIAIQGDIATYESCQSIVSEINNHFASVDIVIHNAGPYIHERKKMIDYSVEEWNYIINGNLNSVFYLSKLLLPAMRAQNWGRFIMVGFDRVETAPGWLYRSAFAAAKTGLASLMRTIALEEAEFGITANMVCPGDIIGEWKEKDIQDSLECKDEKTPVGRPGTGEDIARVIAFLIAEQSSFLTGSVIPVTGGKDVLGKIHYQKDHHT